MGNIKDLLTKFNTTPGLCSHEEVLEVKSFMTDYKKYHDIFKESYGFSPELLFLDGELKKIIWYERNSLR